jgi:hypothetical protein
VSASTGLDDVKKRMVAIRITYRISVGKPEGKKSLMSPKHRWKNDMMDLKEVGHEVVYWIQVTWFFYSCLSLWSIGHP